MPWGILLLPLLGGYVFVTQFKLSRYFARRHSRERLLLLAALAGVLFSAIGRLAALLAASCLPSLVELKHDFADVPYLGSAAIALALGLVAWYPANLLISERKEIRWITRYGDDHLQKLLYSAQRKRRMVSITLESGKVYVGHIIRVPLNMVSADSHIEIAPNMSGYRDPTTKKVNFTTFYDDVILLLGEKNRPEWLHEDDFYKVIPVTRIEVTGFFDPDAYLAFLSRDEPE